MKSKYPYFQYSFPMFGSSPVLGRTLLGMAFSLGVTASPAQATNGTTEEELLRQNILGEMIQKP